MARAQGAGEGKLEAGGVGRLWLGESFVSHTRAWTGRGCGGSGEVFDFVLQKPDLYFVLICQSKTIIRVGG